MAITKARKQEAKDFCEKVFEKFTNYNSKNGFDVYENLNEFEKSWRYKAHIQSTDTDMKNSVLKNQKEHIGIIFYEEGWNLKHYFHEITPFIPNVANGARITTFKRLRHFDIFRVDELIEYLDENFPGLFIEFHDIDRAYYTYLKRFDA